MTSIDTASHVTPDGRPRIAFDRTLLAEDMASKGWLAKDLARESGVSEKTVSRFLRDEGQTARTIAKFAKALGYGPRRYVVRRESGR